MADVLTLGGVAFDDFSTPNEMMGGGRQTMVVHKLPGGSRVIDTLGPDEANIVWNGQFFGNDAYTKALIIDGMRAQGGVVSLTWGGQHRSVIIEQFIYKVRRIPTWVNYNISLMVYQNASLGPLTAVVQSMDNLISSDLDVAIGLTQ
jgi:hypothetical protein